MRCASSVTTRVTDAPAAVSRARGRGRRRRAARDERAHDEPAQGSPAEKASGILDRLSAPMSHSLDRGEFRSWITRVCDALGTARPYLSCFSWPLALPGLSVAPVSVGVVAGAAVCRRCRRRRAPDCRSDGAVAAGGVDAGSWSGADFFALSSLVVFGRRCRRRGDLQSSSCSSESVSRASSPGRAAPACPPSSPGPVARACPLLRLLRLLGLHLRAFDAAGSCAAGSSM